MVSINMYTNGTFLPNYNIPVFIIPDCDEINKCSYTPLFYVRFSYFQHMADAFV